MELRSIIPCVTKEAPVEEAKFYNDTGADAVAFFDSKASREGLEQNIPIIREIARAIDIPIIACGGVRRLEDVKKLLYAGASKVCMKSAPLEDIGIVREDYERFLRLVPKILPEHLELRSYRDKSDHHYYFSRIVDTRYEMNRNGSIVSRKENLWVDIFPLDGMPNNWLVRKIHMLELLWLRLRYHVACFDKVNLNRPNRPLSERIVIALVKDLGISGHKNYKKWLIKLDCVLRRYKVQDTNWIVNFMGQYKFKEMFPKSYYGKGKLYQFEDMQLMGPEDADKVLTQMYGDYMKEPEDCDKNVHDAQLVEQQA